MNVSSIKSFQSSNASFCGHWVSQKRQKYIGVNDGEIQNYVPDPGESLESIVMAWKQKTRLTPIEWVKEYNPYNQSDQKIEYRINGSAYMPLPVLEESVKMQAQRKGSYPIDNISMYTELAKLALQKGDNFTAKSYEKDMIDNFRSLTSPTYEEMASFDMDSYKDGFGTDIKAKVRYGVIPKKYEI